jgi:tRNA(Ile)-lysidine synthase TilS/MesJ
MEEESNENDVSIIRPFLSLSKKEIKAYAAKKKLAFMQNSTPAWSMRGQIRNELNNSAIFNEDFVNGLLQISKTLKATNSHYIKIVNAIQMETISQSPLTISLSSKDFIDDHSFFSLLFARITETNLMPHISKRAIKTFMANYKTHKSNQINCKLTIEINDN